MLTLIWKYQLNIILVAEKDMVYLHCSCPENCWSKRFVSNQYRNEVSLHLWMDWWSCLLCYSNKIILMVLFAVENWIISQSCVYLCRVIVLFLAVFFPFFPFLSSLQCNNNFSFRISGSEVHCFVSRLSLPSKTNWEKCSLLLVPIVNFS